MRRNQTDTKLTGLFVLGLVVAVIGGSLTTGDASTTGHKWLTFFFDGVPPEKPTNSPVVVPIKKDHAAPSPAQRIPAGPVMVVHPPFAAGKCTECHGDSGMSPQPKMPSLQLCFTCHKDFLAGTKVKHQPVEDGDCASCHDPHQSPNKNLLLKKGNELCLTCHDDPLAAGKVKHEAVESGDCLDCHSPHATNFKGLL